MFSSVDIAYQYSKFKITFDYRMSLKLDNNVIRGDI